MPGEGARRYLPPDFLNVPICKPLQTRRWAPRACIACPMHSSGHFSLYRSPPSVENVAVVRHQPPKFFINSARDIGFSCRLSALLAVPGHPRVEPLARLYRARSAAIQACNGSRHGATFRSSKGCARGDRVGSGAGQSRVESVSSGSAALVQDTHTREFRRLGENSSWLQRVLFLGAPSGADASFRRWSAREGCLLAEMSRLKLGHNVLIKWPEFPVGSQQFPDIRSLEPDTRESSIEMPIAWLPSTMVINLRPRQGYHHAEAPEHSKERRLHHGTDVGYTALDAIATTACIRPSEVSGMRRRAS